MNLETTQCHPAQHHQVVVLPLAPRPRPRVPAMLRTALSGHPVLRGAPAHLRSVRAGEMIAWQATGGDYFRLGSAA